MDQQKNRKIISAIVPAYNEARRIERVLEILIAYPDFLEIIVVDDGSEDNTKEVLQKYENSIIYIRNYCRMGKGYALQRGVNIARGEILFFCDADVKGLSKDIIHRIVSPVVREETEMFIGMRNRKIYLARFIIPFIPLFGGERALTRFLWEIVPDYFKNDFRVEAGLNFYAEKFGRGYKFKIFKGMSQVIKERKYGFAAGFKQRLLMYADVIVAEIRLSLIELLSVIKIDFIKLEKVLNK